MWDYPLFVTVDGEQFEIENNCDYRVVLDCLDCYEDNNLDLITQHQSALVIFYKEPQKIKNVEEAVKQMIRVIDCQSEEEFAENSELKQCPKMKQYNENLEALYGVKAYSDGKK